jgi:hypothetical protein
VRFGALDEVFEVDVREAAGEIAPGGRSCFLLVMPVVRISSSSNRLGSATVAATDAGGCGRSGRSTVRRAPTWNGVGAGRPP